MRGVGRAAAAALFLPYLYAFVFPGHAIAMALGGEVPAQVHGDQVIICTPHGLTTVSLEDFGGDKRIPAKTTYHCPFCTGQAHANAVALPLPALGTPTSEPLLVVVAEPSPARPRVYTGLPRARAPPLSLV